MEKNIKLIKLSLHNAVEFPGNKKWCKIQKPGSLTYTKVIQNLIKKDQNTLFCY